MALSKDEVQLLKEMIADDSISKQEKDMYREMLGDTPDTASKPANKKATKKKSTPKKKKVSESDIDKMKAQIKQRTGKTEEECEKIVDEYRALRKKATTRKKKETATKEKSKQRTTKLKKEGKVIEGTTEKNVEATIDTATKTATKKVDKEITKIEKTTKGEKQVEKKIDQLVKKALASSKKFVSDMAKELSTKSKDDGRTYLMGLRSQIDALLKKYELGGEVFDGSGDSINFGGGGYTQPMDIQASLIMQGNNTNFEEGGDVFDGSGDSVNYAKGGKITDSMIWNNMQDDGDIIEHWASDVGGSNESVDNIITYSNGKKYLVTTNFDQDMLLTPSKIATEWEDEYAKGGKVYSIDIDTQDGNEIRDFQYTHNEFGLHQATEYFNKLKARGIVEYNDKGHLISNIQLLEVDEKGDYKVLDSKFFDEFEQGGKTQGYNDRLDESLGSRRGTSMSHHQNYKDRRDESKGMETGMGRRAYRGVNTMDNN